MDIETHIREHALSVLIGEYISVCQILKIIEQKCKKIMHDHGITSESQEAARHAGRQISCNDYLLAAHVSDRKTAENHEFAVRTRLVEQGLSDSEIGEIRTLALRMLIPGAN